jgi:UDP:flavonoid glycosyltransferase YjiC (YdhE family)
LIQAAGGGGGRRRILFTTSNGTGLGHLTRSMAIARRLDESLEPLFITLSAAAPVVREMGFPVEYLPSYATPASGNDYRWSRRLRARLRAAIAETDPAVIVFDGTHPYEALLGALPERPTAVWCRRPMWQRGASRVPLGRAGAFDAVLEPGELAASEDRGPTVALRERAHRVDPIVLLDRDELVFRTEAESELGLAHGLTNVLVTLGQGEEVREASRRTLAHLAGRDGVQVVALASTLAALDDVPEGVVLLRSTYPMSRYFAAFDAAISAAGYNAFHELIELGVPSLFVPMRRDTDDQAARARWAANAGVGLAVEGPADPLLEALIDRLLSGPDRRAFEARIADLEPRNGAGDAARWLSELARADEAPTAPGGPASPAGKRGGAREFRRRWGQFFASVPRTAVRLARQQLTKPRARTWIVALGLDPAETARAVGSELAESGEDPRRTLAITDQLDALAALRGLGVGVEHVPGRDERQPELADGTYEGFLARRLELIGAERPHPRAVRVAPGSAPLP